MRSPWIPASCLAFLAFLWHLSYAGYGLVAQDEGWLLHAATRVAGGEVPYRDFLTAYVPGRYYLVAGVLDLFGASLPAVRVLFCVLRALVVLLVFLVGARAGSAGAATAAALTVAVLPGPWHKTFFTLVPLLVIAPLLRWERRRDRRWLVFAGLLAGAGFWFRQDAAVAGALGAALLVGLTSTRRVGDLAALSGAAAAAALVPLLLLGMAGVTPADVIRQSVAGAAAVGTPAGDVAGQILRFDLDGYRAPHNRWLPALAWISVAIAVAAVCVGCRRSRGEHGAAVGLTTLLLANQLFRDFLLIRFLQLGALTYLLFFALAFRLPAPARLPAAVLPLLLAAYVMGTNRNRPTQIEYTGTIAVRGRPTVPLDVRGHTLHVSSALGQPLSELATFLGEETEPGEPILVLGNPAIAYFLVDRPNPTARIRFGEEHREELDRAWMRDVRRRGCHWIVVPRSWDSRHWLPQLFPMAHQPIVGKRIGAWTVWSIA